MSGPAVSVILPTRDRPELLRCALASIAGQTFLAEGAVEVVVVNDGGAEVRHVVSVADVVTDVLDELVDGGVAGRLRVRLITLPSHRGLAAARNAGLAAARGEWVAFLDDDDVWLPGHLAVALGAADRAGVELAHTTCVIADRRLTPHTAPWLQKPIVFDQSFDAATLMVTNYVAVTSVVCRNPRTLGVWFDEGAQVQEDWRLWLRMAVGHGWRGVHVDEPTAVYHRIPTAPSMTAWPTGAAEHAAAGLRAFAAGAEEVWALWPSRRPQVERGRIFTRAMYDLCGERLRGHRPVSHFYYERSFRSSWRPWTDGWMTSKPWRDSRLRSAVLRRPRSATIVERS